MLFNFQHSFYFVSSFFFLFYRITFNLHLLFFSCLRQYFSNVIGKQNLHMVVHKQSRDKTNFKLNWSTWKMSSLEEFTKQKTKQILANKHYVVATSRSKKISLYFRMSIYCLFLYSQFCKLYVMLGASLRCHCLSYCLCLSEGTDF